MLNIFSLNALQAKIFLYKKGPKGKFREIFKAPWINWCEIMENTTKYSSIYMVKIGILFFKSKFPEIFRKCPFRSFEMHKSNLTFDNNIVAVFPAGIYNASLILKYKNDVILFEFGFIVELY